MHEPLNMTEGVTQPMSQPTAEPGPVPAPEKASLLRVLRDQKKTLLVAAVMVVATYWIAGQFGEWELAACISGGVLLGLANHLMTELWLLRIITSGAEPTRGQMIASTLTRLGAADRRRGRRRHRRSGPTASACCWASPSSASSPW